MLTMQPSDRESVPFENQAQPVNGDIRQPVNVEENVEITPFSSKVLLFFVL